MIDKILGIYDCTLVGVSILFATFAFASAFEFGGTGRRLWRWLVIGIVCAGFGFESRYLPAALRVNLRLLSMAVLVVSFVSIVIGIYSAQQSKSGSKTGANRDQRARTERNIHIHG